MDTQKIQKYCRLQKFVALAALGLLNTCATSLKTKDDLPQAPPDLQQKIEDLPGVVEGVYAPLPPGPESGFPYVKEVSLPPPSKEKRVLASKKEKIKAAKVAKEKSPAKSSGKAVAKVPTWHAQAWPYGNHERLTYVLQYGLIEGGIVTFSVEDFKTVDGQKVVLYRGHVKSSKVLELFYKVDDTIDSYVSLENHLPLRQEINQLESSRWGRRVVVFDQKNQIARYYAKATKKDGTVEENKRDDPMAAFAQDVFGALYFYRFVPDLKTLNFPIHDRWKNWANQLTYVENEKVKVPAGEFDTMKFKMLPRVSGNLEPKGDVTIWVTDDDRKIMVKFSAKIKVGSITGQLKTLEEGQKINFPTPTFKTPTNLALEGEIQK